MRIQLFLHEFLAHGWVRDNVYAALGVWALYRAYHKSAEHENDQTKAKELSLNCVKTMQSLMECMMRLLLMLHDFIKLCTTFRQINKVESFKLSQKKGDSLHSKYSVCTKSVSNWKWTKYFLQLFLQTVVGDNDWGHMQIDAVSLFLLILAQMTASGKKSFISNRFYDAFRPSNCSELWRSGFHSKLGLLYRNKSGTDKLKLLQNRFCRLPDSCKLLLCSIISGLFYAKWPLKDFGIWERGDKTNQGIRELNVSSIGMAKAAMQALSDVGDLFGDGSKSSCIHVLPDEIQQCSAVLSSMLPRESFSKVYLLDEEWRVMRMFVYKETDAALLSIISYPAFAVEDVELVELTRQTIQGFLFQINR